MGLYASVNTLMRWLTAISTEPCLKAWTEALLLPGEKTLEESLLAELAQFFHLTKGQVRARCLSATADLAREWQQRNPQTAQDMVDFYLNIAPRIYPFELMWRAIGRKQTVESGASRGPISVSDDGLLEAS